MIYAWIVFSIWISVCICCSIVIISCLKKEQNRIRAKKVLKRVWKILLTIGCFGLVLSIVLGVFVSSTLAVWAGLATLLALLQVLMIANIRYVNELARKNIQTDTQE